MAHHGAATRRAHGGANLAHVMRAGPVTLELRPCEDSSPAASAMQPFDLVSLGPPLPHGWVRLQSVSDKPCFVGSAQLLVDRGADFAKTPVWNFP